MSANLPSNADLISEIRRLLPSAITPALSPSSKGNDLFEGFLFMLVLDAAKSPEQRESQVRGLKRSVDTGANASHIARQALHDKSRLHARCS